jgi:2-hydroxychromene-2-carboxylate isomerase
MAQELEPVRFYFSFRSPYSWLAFERIERAFRDVPVQLSYLPVFPPPNYPNDPAAVPNKLKYVLFDVARQAAEYGFAAMKPPSVIDTEWVRPHAAFVYAQDQGRGHAFGLAMSRARFCEGLDVGDNAVVRAIAKRLEIDPDATVAASDDVAYQTRVVEGMIQGATEDSIFGVPLFVYKGEPFWGNDRIEWLLRAIKKANGQSVPSLREDCLKPVL